MRAERKGWIILGLCVASLLVGFAGCQHTLGALSTPRPIAEQDVSGPFYVIGFLDSGTPELLQHEIGLQNERKYYGSEAAFHKAYGKGILWSMDCRNNRDYRFYIDPARRTEVEKTLTTPIRDSGRSVTIRILENHPATKSQKVYIDFWNDDSNYFSIYSVDNRSVTPLEYGDMTKGDGFQALVTGFVYMILFYVAGRIVFAIVLRRQFSLRLGAGS